MSRLEIGPKATKTIKRVFSEVSPGHRRWRKIENIASGDPSDIQGPTLEWGERAMLHASFDKKVKKLRLFYEIVKGRSLSSSKAVSIFDNEIDRIKRRPLTQRQIEVFNWAHFQIAQSNAKQKSKNLSPV